MTKSDFDDARIRNACQERCAGFGDPACFELEEKAVRPDAPIAHRLVKACDDCLRECGYEPAEPLDENAAVRPLL